MTYGGIEGPLHGATRDNAAIYTVPDGQFITGVAGGSGGVVDGFHFITNMGEHSPHYGGDGGILFTVDSGEPGCVISPVYVVIF